MNEGWLIKDTGSGGVRLRTSEYGPPDSERPILTVNWSANTTPIVAAAIPDTTVNEDNPPIDNYRDLKAVFTDAEEGSGLIFSIESNTNSGLVTPTIVPADSTLDLSFTASTSGTATITIRATDAGGLFVDDVFTVTVTDSTPPDAITDLATGTVTDLSVLLSWTAPGDDGATGTATTYDVRYSTSTIIEANWASATQASGEPSPQIAGSSESFTVTGLSETTTYYFAIKTSDEVPNESAISNETATDITVNTNDGQLGNTAGADSSDPNWMCVAGGNALRFDGTDDYVEIPNIDISGGGTVMGWMKFDNLTSDHALAGVHDLLPDVAANEFQIWMDDKWS